MWENIKWTSLNDMGTAALQAVADGVYAALFASPGPSAMVNESVFIGGNSFYPVAGGGLEVDIYPGRALYFRSELAAYDPDADPFGFDVVPIFLNEQTTITLDAHHGTHPRWDVITMKWAATDGTEVAGYKRKEGPGSQVAENVQTSRSYGPDINVTKGTAGASPAVPTAPTDEMPIAHVYVPGGSGNVVVYDVRKTGRLGDGAADGPVSPTFGQPFVASGLTASAPGGMAVALTAGSAYDGRTARPTPAVTVTISTAHGTHPRIDLIYLDGGRITYLAGTAAASPSAPPLPSGTYGTTQALYTVTVPAGDTAIALDQITDIRTTKPYTLDAHVEYTPTVYARVSVAAQQSVSDPNPTYRRITVQAVDQEGNEIAAVVYFRVSMWTGDVDEIETAHGSAGVNNDVTPLAKRIDTDSYSGIFATDSTGEVIFDVFGTSVDAYLKVTPIDWGDASDDTAALASEATYKPGGETLRKVGFR